MGWDVVDSGFKVVLSRQGAAAGARARCAATWTRFLAEHGLDARDIKHWVAHTGGPKVLEAFEDALELPRDALQRSWDSLRRWATSPPPRCSSCWRTLLEAGEARPGDRGLLLAMGPGSAPSWCCSNGSARTSSSSRSSAPSASSSCGSRGAMPASRFARGGSGERRAPLPRHGRGARALLRSPARPRCCSCAVPSPALADSPRRAGVACAGTALVGDRHARLALERPGHRGARRGPGAPGPLPVPAPSQLPGGGHRNALRAAGPRRLAHAPRVFSALNAASLASAIRAEERALGSDWEQAFAGVPRFIPHG